MPVHPLFARSVLFWPCLPLVIPQALHLRRHATRWPDATGPRSGCVGVSGTASREALRLLALGDSPFAGVAIERIEATMPVRLARLVGDACGRAVAWRIVARSGATVRAVLTELWPRVTTPPFDLILVSVGVNDVTGLTRRRAFASDLTRLLRGLGTTSPDALVVLLGVPPMQAFPLLPQPLRAWLGGRSQALDRVGRECAVRAGALHLPFETVPSPELFAADGFHPSPEGNALWAERVFEALRVSDTVRAWRCG